MKIFGTMALALALGIGAGAAQAQDTGLPAPGSTLPGSPATRDAAPTNPSPTLPRSEPVPDADPLPDPSTLPDRGGLPDETFDDTLEPATPADPADELQPDVTRPLPGTAGDVRPAPEGTTDRQRPDSVVDRLDPANQPPDEDPLRS